jgi:hypothetical protein
MSDRATREDNQGFQMLFHGTVDFLSSRFAELGSQSIWLYLVIRGHENHKTNSSTIGIPRLCEIAQLSRATVYRYLKLLEGAELIRRFKERNGSQQIDVLPTQKNFKRKTQFPLFNSEEAEDGERLTPETVAAIASSHAGDKTVSGQRRDCLTPENSNSPVLMEQEFFNKRTLTRGEKKRAPDLSPLALARGLLEQTQLPITTATLTAVAAALQAIQKQRGHTYPECSEWLVSRVVAAREAGSKVNRFWFEDADYELANGGMNGKPSRSEQNLTSILDARAVARRAVGLDR